MWFPWQSKRTYRYLSDKLQGGVLSLAGLVPCHFLKSPQKLLRHFECLQWMQFWVHLSSMSSSGKTIPREITTHLLLIEFHLVISNVSSRNPESDRSFPLLVPNLSHRLCAHSTYKRQRFSCWGVKCECFWALLILSYTSLHCWKPEHSILGCIQKLKNHHKQWQAKRSHLELDTQCLTKTSATFLPDSVIATSHFALICRHFQHHPPPPTPRNSLIW